MKIRDIGNSKGIILPKHMLSQCNIADEVTIEVKNNHIEITPVSIENKKGWAESFKKMAEEGDDKMIIPDIFNEEHFDDWTW